MKKTIMMWLILAMIVLSGCGNSDTPVITQPELTAEASVVIENNTDDDTDNLTRDKELMVSSVPLEHAPFAEPVINNGASFIKAYNGGTFYADNLFLRMIHPQKGVIPNASEPMAMDIYKSVIYYIKDDFSTFYSIDLRDFSFSELFHDVNRVQTASFWGMFILAEDTIFYSDTNDNLCSRTLSGDNKRVLSGNNVMNLKYRNGWLYYIDNMKGRLWRIKTDGSKDECIIDQEIDYYYLTSDSIVYQTAENYTAFVKEQKDDGSVKILMQKELTHKQSMSSGQFQLIDVRDGEVYYYQDTGDVFTVYKFSDGVTSQLAELSVDNYVYPLQIIDSWIYCFADTDDEEAFYRVNIDGTSTERVGDFYSVPWYFLE